MKNTRFVSRRELKADKMMQDIDSLPPDSFPAKVRRFIQLEKERRELEARIKLIEDEGVTLKEQIGDELEKAAMNGLDSHVRAEGMTVFLSYRTWARPKDGNMSGLCDSILQSGDGELIELVHPTVDLNALSKIVKEKLEEAADNDTPDDEILPPEIMENLHVSTVRYVKTRTGKSEG